MTIYYVFPRGSSNAFNSIESCVWIGEAKSREAAREEASENPCTASCYNGQYLEALPQSAMNTTDRDSAWEASQIQTCPVCKKEIETWEYSVSGICQH